ncbi:aminoglycoside phosphotransferase family protein [Paracoccus seriniphilus]|uniref:aminoglycoside phosphotransferase family protein n=1 Tax=Paracoccus seriniphilus TaxID=184748 RepID=UPI003561AA24
MARPDAVVENMSFLLAELDGQLTRLTSYMQEPHPEVALQLVQRAGYSNNLSARVRKACLAGMMRAKLTEAQRLRLQGIDTIARNLDLVSRLGRRAVEHAEQAERHRLLRTKTYVAPVTLVGKTIACIPKAMETSDSRLAVEIGRSRSQIDIFHDRLFRTYTRDMRGSKHSADLAHGLLTLNEIHRMGEGLSAISEALLSMNIGQAVQFDRYFTLRSVLGGGKGDEEVRLQPLAETRSGSAISSVNLRNAKGETVAAVFKDGDRRKVKQERVGVKSWNSVYPGLAPEILSYERHGKSAALLIEHLEGETLEDIVVAGSDEALARAQKALHKTVGDIWRQTRTEEPAEMKAMEQLGKRMKDVYRLHPRFAQGARNLNGLRIPDLDELIAAAARREAGLTAPFSVYIHGDFNLDNVIHDAVGNKIRFIDLHRSRYMDYVQDVSVFMVSNYRLQVLDSATRNRIAKVASDMHAMAAKFARGHRDPTFEFRLALGLARSFASSTRFVVDQNHARRMILRARYILESALAVPEGREARFKLPIRMLFSD